MKEWKQEFKDHYTIGDYVFKAEVIPDDVINFIDQIISERDAEINNLKGDLFEANERIEQLQTLIK